MGRRGAWSTLEVVCAGKGALELLPLLAVFPLALEQLLWFVGPASAGREERVGEWVVGGCGGLLRAESHPCKHGTRVPPGPGGRRRAAAWKDDTQRVGLSVVGLRTVVESPPSGGTRPGGGGGESHSSSSTGRSRRGRHQRAAQPHTYRPARPFFAPQSMRARASEREMGVTRRGHRGRIDRAR